MIADGEASGGGTERPAARRLRVRDVRSALPDVDELHVALDLLMARSEADRAWTWSGSGELATVDGRLVAPNLLTSQAAALAAAEADHLTRLYGTLGRALEALEAGDAAAAGRALLDAGALEEERERPARARAYAAAAHQVTRGERDQGTAALALRRGARASRALGDLAEALDAYKRSYEMARAMDDGRGAAEAAVGAGNTLEEQGRWSAAAAWYRRALDATAEVERDVPERWHALLCLHIVTRSAGAVSESVPLLEQAAEAADEDRDAARPFLENARGQLSMSEGDFRAAEHRFREALVHARGARARVTIAVNLAEALLAQGRTLEAAEQARSAELDAIRAGLFSRLPEVYRVLGRIAAHDANPDALVFFERALEIIRERRLPPLEQAVTLQAYADAEARRGDADAARALRAEAERIFGEAGMAHGRRAWSDVYAPEEAAPEEAAPGRAAAHDEPTPLPSKQDSHGEDDAQ